MDKLFTATELGEAVELTPARIHQLRESGVITGEPMGKRFIFKTECIKQILNRPETRGRKKKSKLVK